MDILTKLAALPWWAIVLLVYAAIAVILLILGHNAPTIDEHGNYVDRKRHD